MFIHPVWMWPWKSRYATMFMRQWRCDNRRWWCERQCQRPHSAQHQTIRPVRRAPPRPQPYIRLSGPREDWKFIMKLLVRANCSAVQCVSCFALPRTRTPSRPCTLCVQWLEFHNLFQFDFIFSPYAGRSQTGKAYWTTNKNELPTEHIEHTQKNKV